MNMLLISNYKHTSDGRMQYMSMFTPDELRGFAKQGKSWRDVAVAQTLPEKTVVGYEKALFMRCVTTWKKRQKGQTGNCSDYAKASGIGVDALHERGKLQETDTITQQINS